MSKKATGFVIRRIDQICEAGLPVLLQKGRKLLLMLLAATAVLLARALRPILDA